MLWEVWGDEQAYELLLDFRALFIKLRRSVQNVTRASITFSTHQNQIKAIKVRFVKHKAVKKVKLSP
jgi:hypothetical protein